jgi:DhnA family fructose-bisphosphate aldolase class Ia
MKRRMHRLLRPDGRILVVAMDHTLFMPEPVPGLVEYAGTCRAVVPAGADAFLSPLGSLVQLADAFGDAAVIASLQTGDAFLPVAVDQAAAAGADAVKCMVYPLAGDDSVDRAARIGADAARLGLPFMAEPIPGGFGRPDLHTPDAIAAAARIAAEAGADIVKTLYPGDPESMRRVVDYALVPVIVLGGAKKDDLRDLYTQVHDAVILGGAAGVAIGNNIWRAADPAAVTRGLAAIIHAGASVDEALSAAGIQEGAAAPA